MSFVSRRLNYDLYRQTVPVFYSYLFLLACTRVLKALLKDHHTIYAYLNKRYYSSTRTRIVSVPPIKPGCLPLTITTVTLPSALKNPFAFSSFASSSPAFSPSGRTNDLFA